MSARPSQASLPPGEYINPPAVQTATATRRPQSASRSSRLPARAVGSPTLVLRVTGPDTKVFVRTVGGEVLLNGLLRQGDERRYDNQRLALVVYDASAVQVIINGVPQRKGLPGQRKTFQIKKTGQQATRR